MGILSHIFSSTPQAKAKLQVPTTTPATRERIKNILGIRDLESMPAQAARAFQLASDPKSSLGDFVKVIESDEALSSRIIRIANSVYFYRGTKVSELEKAVANIGLTEIRGLLSATMLRGLLRAKGPSRESIWRHSVLTAMYARRLSALSNQVSEGSAFLAGILHDVGKLIMLTQNQGGYSEVIRLTKIRPITSIEAEEEVFDLNHIEVGKWVGERWNFPEPVLHTIAFHHEPWPVVVPTDNSKRDILTIIKAANAFSHCSSIEQSRTASSSTETSREELKTAEMHLGLDKETTQGIIKSTSLSFEQEYGLFAAED